MKVSIINHYYSISSVHRYNEDFEIRSHSIMLDYYRSINIGIVGCVARRISIALDSSIEIYTYYED